MDSLILVEIISFFTQYTNFKKQHIAKLKPKE